MSMSDFVGQTLGQYRIESLLDAGGMGQVFRGVHIYLNRPAAIKVMRPHLAARATFRERFLQEARSAAALKHANIVDIYEFGEQEGQLYLVMELVPDGSLRSLLYKRANRSPRPLPLDLELVRQAAEGLAAAHALGVVHRDVKPDNMLLMRTSAPGVTPELYQLKISDFGLARLAEGSGLTATGAPMGTLAYMSPEQCLGWKVDGRGDLYSLGVVLYEVATGYLPFQIESFDDALRKHTQAEPPSPRQIRSDISPDLEAIILRCLAKKPEDRYQTGSELARDLQRVIGSTVVQSARVSPSAPTEVDERARNKTELRPASLGNETPTPIVATLQGYSSVPRVRVLDKSGQTLQVVEMTNRSIIVGRQPGNPITLQSGEVSRQHLEVQWDGQQVTIKDLGSSNGTLLEGVKLQPQISYPWQERQNVHLGPFWLRLEGAATDATVAQPIVPSNLPPSVNYAANVTEQRFPQASVSGTAAVGSGNTRIGIRAEPSNLTIVPGQPANVRVMLTNLGVLVDWLAVTVEGVPKEWVRTPGSEIQLNPGMQETVDLSVNVARTPESRAQEYPVVIRARSREKPSESGTAQARWTVLPFKDDGIKIEPRRASGRGRAKYTVTLANNGNAPARYELHGEDDEQKIHYAFREEALALEPGNEVRIPLAISTNRRIFGRDQNQRFQVQSRVNMGNTTVPGNSSSAFAGNNALTTNAEFVNKALIPPWVLTLVSVLLVLAIIGGSAYAVLSHQPTTTTGQTLQTGQTGTGTIIQTTPPSNSVPPMAVTPPAAPTVALPTMQAGTTTGTTTASTTHAFVTQATTVNSNKNFTVINNTLINNNANAGVFITQNATPQGSNGQVLNPHPVGIWFNNSNWAIFNEDAMTMTQQASFNVWIPTVLQHSFIQQATTANISGSGTAINNPLVNNQGNLILVVTQIWNPGGQGGVFNPHPIGVAFNNGQWVIFNEDGTAMPPQASFNVHLLNPSNSNFVQTAATANMTNGATVIDNPLINNDPKAIIIVTQFWNPGGSATGVYNNHPVGVAFNGQNWEIVNEDQTPIPQGASFNVVVVQR